MPILKSFLIIVAGLLMFGTYLAILVAFSKFAAHVSPTFGILLFLAFAVVTALGFIRLQTYLERVFILRHVANNPDSSWRYIVAK